MRNRMQTRYERSLRTMTTTLSNPAWGGIIDDIRKIIPHLAALIVVWGVIRKLRYLASYLAMTFG